MQISYGQEICDNAIDDDGDGHIDLNDEECICGSIYGEIMSLIPNPSFEEMDCCPFTYGQLDCATDWVQASDASSDYYNTCDFTAILDAGVTSADITDIPDGNGWVGYFTLNGYQEYIGACLNSPLLVGVEYTLDFSIAWGDGSPTHEFTIFGSPNCADLPWSGIECPIGLGSWEFLTSESITSTMDGSWQEVTITFTPSIEMDAIAFGANCGTNEDLGYTYIDHLILLDSDGISTISESGSLCADNSMLETTTDTTGGAWQWFLDGIALIGENSATIDVTSYGTGDYSAVYYIEDSCIQFNYTLSPSTDLALELISNEPTCFGFSDGSVSVNVEVLEGELTFEIKDEDGNLMNEDNSNTANTLTSGWYYINVSHEIGCEGIDSIFIDQPEELAIDLTRFDALCAGDPTGWVRVDSVYNSTGDYNNISYIWNPNPAGVGGIGADSSYSMSAGDYTLAITDDNGCSNVFNFVINEPTPLVFAEFGFDPAYCRLFGYQNGNGVAFGAATEGTPDYDYLWTNLDNGATSINSTWGGLNPGNYQLTVTDANGCILTQSLVLDSLNPIAAFTVLSDQLNSDCQGLAPVEVEFVNNSTHFANPAYPDSDTTFFWNLDTPNAVWQISEDWYETFDTTYLSRGQTYTVDVCLVAINKNGCTDTACKIITIFEPPVVDPVNIFSPNGDGMNDEFTFIFKSAAISEFQCEIVNRWGIVVGELNSISDSWNGTDTNGERCADGVYFYTYKATTDNNIKLEGQGSLQIIGGK
jgi:gliding motility-associated-like protein